VSAAFMVLQHNTKRHAISKLSKLLLTSFLKLARRPGALQPCHRSGPLDHTTYRSPYAVGSRGHMALSLSTQPLEQSC
jgi:hypothetical protein